MAARVHLVRHGEVENPQHLVYASLPGFGLSQAGLEQAQAAARYLGRQPVVAVWSSPLERALRTAETIAGRVDQPVHVEPELVEWQLMDRWAGVSWDDLPDRFPGELEALLERPFDLPFSPESLEQLSRRIGDIVRRLDAAHPHGEVVVVSHSAPIRAAILDLTGEPLTSFRRVEPGHGSVTTLRPGSAWKVETAWSPEEP
jgi:broad specificity phosphatase PhoE